MIDSRQALEWEHLVLEKMMGTAPAPVVPASAAVPRRYKCTTCWEWHLDILDCERRRNGAVAASQ